MARNAGKHDGFLCLSSALIQHSKRRIYTDFGQQTNVLRNKPYFCHMNLISGRLKHYKSKHISSINFITTPIGQIGSQ